MITYVTGNIFDSPAEVLVNPVNCVGTMGAGLARQFRERFHENYKRYLIECGHGRLLPGGVFWFDEAGKEIANFPTKYHWRDFSKLGDIKSGLDDLVAKIAIRGVRSIAIPALGCGLGGLNWSDVKPLIERGFSWQAGTDLTAYVYPPEGQ